jgi:DNA gyrase subunit A
MKVCCEGFDLPTGSGFGEPVQHLFKFGDGERPIIAMNLTTVFAGTTTGEEQDSQTELVLAPREVKALTVSAKGIGFKFDLGQFNSVTTRAGKKFAGVRPGDSIQGVEILDLPNVLSTTEVGCRHSGQGILLCAGKGVKLVNVKNGEVALEPVRKAKR